MSEVRHFDACPGIEIAADCDGDWLSVNGVRLSGHYVREFFAGRIPSVSATIERKGDELWFTDTEKKLETALRETIRAYVAQEKYYRSRPGQCQLASECAGHAIVLQRVLADAGLASMDWSTEPKS
jgi:hypothetical protein